MKLAARMSQIKPSATLTINAKALELKSQGLNIISLAVGEPDFPTPKHVCDAAKAAMDEGFTKYTAVPGIAPLRQAVVDYFERLYKVKAEVANTIVTNGGKQALYNIFLALLNPGDEVLVPAPYWVSYPDMVSLADGVFVPVFTDASQNFKVTPEILEKQYTAKSRILLLNSPSNPTGIAYSQEELDALADWAIKKGLFIISDEIYDQLMYDNLPSASLSPWWEKYPQQVAIVNGLAKAYSMSGWRVGFVLADKGLIKAMSEIQGQTTANICSIAQKGALAALTGPQDTVETMRQAFERRRDMALKEISSWEGVLCPKPQGAFYLFFDVGALFTKEVPDAASMCTMLLEKAHVALVPGCAFGAPTCLRISYAIADDVLEKALQSIKKALFS